MLMCSMPVTFIVVKCTVILPMWILRPVTGRESHPPCTRDGPSIAGSSACPANWSTAPRGTHLPSHSAPRRDQSLDTQSHTVAHCLPPAQGTHSGPSQASHPGLENSHLSNYKEAPTAPENDCPGQHPPRAGPWGSCGPTPTDTHAPHRSPPAALVRCV